MTYGRVGLGLLNLLAGLLTTSIAVFFALGVYAVAVGADAIPPDFVLFAVAFLVGLFGFALAFVPAVLGWLARSVSDVFVARTSLAGLAFAGLGVLGVALGGLTAPAVAVSAVVAALLAAPLVLNVLVVRAASRRNGDSGDEPFTGSETGGEDGLRHSL